MKGKNSGGLLLLAVFLAAELWAVSAEAIPAFARRYEISCTVCHVAFPKLNSFGESFAGNGYQFPDEDLNEHAVDTGDDKLLLKELPFAVRADSFFRARNDTGVHADLESPFGIKLLSSAPIANNISYYFYFIFNERGSTETGVEDAFLYFNDAYKGMDLDLRIGQFQVSDILFPREQRLTFQDYTIYTTRVSTKNFDSDNF
jgi:hypothetical protein